MRTGTGGAFLDLYEEALAKLKSIVIDIPQEQFESIADPQTNDPNCRSIEAVLNHVIRAGYGYANLYRKTFQLEFEERRNDYDLQSARHAAELLDAMLAYTIETCEKMPPDGINCESGVLIQTHWGQQFDTDQLFEHAVMHIHRHRRQIQRFLITRQLK